ncbi:BON domain-containing protein [Actinoplanes sp. M2I2]|uniref:BON domain-containing protein n=1 Tax=Actinoplanes sp. M2I2 TaxID=1734444 RepID=UPI002020FA65|nr:BON domain-containing protein [Actinoplanes sp. M2I2]
MYFWFHMPGESPWFPDTPEQPDAARVRRAITDHWAETDRAVAVRLALALLHDPAVDGGDLDLRVQSGVAILDGRVPSASARAAAVDRAWSVDGVRDVCDLLRVRRRRPWWRP